MRKLRTEFANRVRVSIVLDMTSIANWPIYWKIRTISITIEYATVIIAPIIFYCTDMWWSGSRPGNTPGIKYLPKIKRRAYGICEKSTFTESLIGISCRLHYPYIDCIRDAPASGSVISMQMNFIVYIKYITLKVNFIELLMTY